jgi:hypothetical protein
MCALRLVHSVSSDVKPGYLWPSTKQIISTVGISAIAWIGGQRPSFAEYQDKTTAITAAIKFHQKNLSRDWQGEVLEYYKFTISKPNLLQVELRSEGMDRSQMGTNIAHILGQAFTWRTYQSRELTAVWRVRGPNEIDFFQEYPSFSRTAHFVVHGNKCSARMTFSLNPGETVFKFPTLRSHGKDWNEYTDIYFTDAVCHIE